MLPLRRGGNPDAATRHVFCCLSHMETRTAGSAASSRRRKGSQLWSAEFGPNLADSGPKWVGAEHYSGRKSGPSLVTVGERWSVSDRSCPIPG